MTRKSEYVMKVIRLTYAQKKAWRAYAKKHHITISELVRQAVEEGIKRGARAPAKKKKVKS